jgi:hypothetical protein
MKKLIYILVLFLLFAACDQVVFPEPQPRKIKALTEFPPNLQGTYLDHNDDTLLVYKQYFSYYADEVSAIKNEYLSDSAVLKYYQKMYFFSRRIMLNNEYYWLTYILNPVVPGEKMDLYAMDPDDIVKLAKLQEITSKISDIENGDSDFYLFAPKKKDFKKIISDTIFTKMISFRKIKN